VTHRVLVAAAAVLLAALVAGCGDGGATLGKQTLSFTEKQNDDSFSFSPTTRRSHHLRTGTSRSSRTAIRSPSPPT